MKDLGVIIIGAGKMGASIGAIIASNGTKVVLIDRDLQKAQDGVNRAHTYITRLFDDNLVTCDITKEMAKECIVADVSYLDHLDSTWMIIEAVFEDITIKQNLFKELDEKVPPHIILASNTSGMMLSRITEGIKTPERTVITHFWYPGHLVPLVEVVRGKHTEQWVIDKVKENLTSWGKAPVVVNKDLPGQLANRILQAIIRESANIVGSGIATAEDVDTAIKMGMALRFPAWGPLEHIDAVGLDLAYSVQKDVLPSLYNGSTPPEIFEKFLSADEQGYKSRKGFYDWNVKDMETLETKRDECIIGILKLLRK
jgi:3-hydroxybutyryl-CoA dehydrogenase